MLSLSEKQLKTLSNEYGFQLDETELDDTLLAVNDRLAELRVVSRLSVFDDRSDPQQRSWRDPRPRDNPYNAIVTDCEVPPTTDHEGTLDGFTGGLKDIIAVKGVPLSCGSPLMTGYIPDADATVVTRLRNAGATITAKTNLDEFANIGQGTNGLNGPIRNPHDDERTAGGSSGGSAVAVATEQVRVAFGTDTGGSVRIPAAYCGVVGFKPTHGIIPMTGVFENTYALDHLGPMARSVRDVAAVLDTVVGKDETDPASMAAAGTDHYQIGGYTSAVTDPPDLSQFQFGIITEGFEGNTADRVANHVTTAIESLENAGAETRHVSVPLYDQSNEIKNTISFVANAAHWHHGSLPARRDGGFSTGYSHQPEFAQRKQNRARSVNDKFTVKVLAGAALLAYDHGQMFRRAHEARRKITTGFTQLFETVDFLLTPTMPIVPPELTSTPTGFNYSKNVRLANLTQSPAITLPVKPIDGLPVGLQIMTDRFNDAKLLGVAERAESVVSP